MFLLIGSSSIVVVLCIWFRSVDSVYDWILMRQKLLIHGCLVRILAQNNLATCLHLNFCFSLLLHLLHQCSSSIFVLFLVNYLCNIAVLNHSHIGVIPHRGVLLTCIRHSLLLLLINLVYRIGCWRELLLILLDYLRADCCQIG